MAEELSTSSTSKQIADENHLRFPYKRLKNVHCLQTVMFWLSAACWIVAGQQLSEAFYNKKGTLECILFARWTVAKRNETFFLIESETEEQEQQESTTDSCELVMFGIAGIGIVAAILACIFLIIYPKEQEFVLKGVSEASDLMIVSGLASVGVVIFAVYADVLLIRGFSFWCSSMGNVLPSCDYSLEVRTGTEAVRPIFIYFLVAQVLVWSGVVFCVAGIVLLVIRVLKHMDYPAVLTIDSTAQVDSVTDESVGN